VDAGKKIAREARKDYLSALGAPSASSALKVPQVESFVFEQDGLEQMPVAEWGAGKHGDAGKR
jgi:hypothetical protein